MKFTVEGGDLFDINETIECLFYIVNSPPREWGGFNPQTVKIARSALKHLLELKGMEKAG